MSVHVDGLHQRALWNEAFPFALSKNLNTNPLGNKESWGNESSERFGSQKLTLSLALNCLILNFLWSLIFILTSQFLALVLLDIKLLSGHEWLINSTHGLASSATIFRDQLLKTCYERLLHQRLCHCEAKSNFQQSQFISSD